MGYRKPLMEPYRNRGKVLRAEDIKTKPVVHPDTIVPVRTIR
jgi:hypothetical protein